MHRYAIDAVRSTDATTAPLVFVPVESDGNPIEGSIPIVGMMPSENVVGIYHPDGKIASEMWFNRHKDRIRNFLIINGSPKTGDNE